MVLVRVFLARGDEVYDTEHITVVSYGEVFHAEFFRLVRKHLYGRGAVQ
jgi:hypothetical protein